MDSKDIVTLLIALYGAGLSTFNLIKQSREKKAQVKVEFSVGLLPWPSGNIEEVILLRARNPGHKKVVLNLPGIVLPDNQEMSFVDPLSDVNFPHGLEPEASCIVWYNIRRFAEQLKTEGYYGEVKLVGYFNDSVGRMHKGKAVNFNIDRWAARS